MTSPFRQKGFSEVRIFDAGMYARMQEYIHYNPVKRHLVPAPAQYPYSSAYRTFELDPPPQALKPVKIVACTMGLKPAS
jgi:hypothetical protein